MLKSSFKKTLIVCIVAVLCCSATLSFAKTDAGMEMGDYDITLDLHENNTMTVSEDIDVNFLEERHGMYRDIPITNTVVSNESDGISKSTYKAVVSDIQVMLDNQLNTPFEQEKVSENMHLKIGDANTTQIGKHNYKINYLYDFGKDKNDDHDFFYYSLTGSKLESVIDHITFKITFPKDFDESKIGFSLGTVGTFGYDESKLKYSVEGNTITGELLRPLYPGESIDIRVVLPQGYFVNPRVTTPNIYMVIIPSIILAIFSLIIFLTVGRRKKRAISVEFSAPEGLNSADVGFINDCSADNRDIVSLLLYWANNGLITIKQIDKKSMEITKVNELDESANDYEKIFFRKLFILGATVTSDQLTYTLGDSFRTACALLKNKFTKSENKITKEKSQGFAYLIIALMPIPVAIMVSISMYYTDFNILDAFIGLFVPYVIGLILTLIFVDFIKENRSGKSSTKIITGVLCLVFTVVFYFVISIFSSTDFSPAAIAIAVASSVVILLVSPFIVTRNDKGEELYARIQGLKHFIKTVEEDKLKLMAEENPEYFYSILPYAYVLGVTDKWSKKFERIETAPPSWYYGYNGSFSTGMFTYIIVSNMMRTSRYGNANGSNGGFGNGSSGGGGFSGGGFSGGGFGGSGGSGSW